MRRIHIPYFLILVIGCFTIIAMPALTPRSGFAQQAARVTHVELFASPSHTGGPCPAMIKFVGSITTSGPGQVTYTFPRSDRAVGPELTLNFEQAGTKEVSTTWTLGDALVLPYYEGWHSIRIVSPNTLESEHATFTVDCNGAKPDKSGTDSGSNSDLRGPGVSMSPPPPSKFNQDLAILKNFASRSRPGLGEAARAAGYDPQTALADYRQISEETDSAKRVEKQAAFDARYTPVVMTLARNANLDLQEERNSLLTELNLDNVSNQPLSTLVIETPPHPVTQPQPPPSPDDVILRQPWSVSGARGDHATATPLGNLTLFATAAGAGESHQVAFLGAPFTVEPGVTRLHAAATFTSTTFEVRAFSLFLFGGYSSAEAILNVRLMEGTQVVAIGHLSLAREITAVVGWGEQNDTRRLTLNCDYTRPNPQAASTYTIVAETEAFAGAGGNSGARVWMNSYLNEIQITKNH